MEEGRCGAAGVACKGVSWIRPGGKCCVSTRVGHQAEGKKKGRKMVGGRMCDTCMPPPLLLCPIRRRFQARMRRCGVDGMTQPLSRDTDWTSALHRISE